MRSIFLLAVSLGYLGTAFAHGEAIHANKEARPLSVERHVFGREGDPKKIARTVRLGMVGEIRGLAKGDRK
jgi:hypothetical protein